MGSLLTQSLPQTQWLGPHAGQPADAPPSATTIALGLNPTKKGQKRAAEAPAEVEEERPRPGLHARGPAPAEAPSWLPPQPAAPPLDRSTVLLPLNFPEVMRTMLLPLNFPPGLLLPPASIAPFPTGPTRAWGGSMTAGVPGRAREESAGSGGSLPPPRPAGLAPRPPPSSYPHPVGTLAAIASHLDAELTAVHAGSQSIDGARASISRAALELFKALSKPVLLVRPPARPGHGPGEPTELTLLDLIAGPPGVALADEGDEVPGSDRMGVLEREHAYQAAASLQNADRFAVEAASGLKRLCREMDWRIAHRRERRIVPLPDRQPRRPDMLGGGVGPDPLPTRADRMRFLPPPPPRSEDAESWSPQPPPRSLCRLSPLIAASPMDTPMGTSPFAYPPSTVMPLAASLARALRGGKGGQALTADPAAPAPPVARVLGFTSPLTRPRFSATHAGLAASDIIASPGRLYTATDLDSSPQPYQGASPLGSVRKMSFGSSPARERRNTVSQ